MTKVLDYQDFDEVGDLIRVNFAARGCGFSEHAKDSQSPFEIDTCKGLAEGMWAIVTEVRKNDDFPITLTNLVMAELRNQPIHQIDDKTGQKIDKGDICEFEDDGFFALGFRKLIAKGIVYGEALD